MYITISNSSGEWIYSTIEVEAVNVPDPSDDENTRSYDDYQSGD